MKKLLMVSNGEHLPARIFKAALILVSTLALAASTASVKAQETPAAMMQAEMPAGQTVQTASKADFLAALCAAVKKHRGSSPALASFAASLRPDSKKDILRTVFRCLSEGGGDNCRLLGAVLRSLTAGDPNASGLTDLATQLAPGCASAFGAPPSSQQPGTEDEGNFGNPPGNLNPPPGSIGGGGGQGNLVAICHNGMTIFVSPQGAEEHLQHHPGDTLGACQVTQTTNN